LNTDIRRRRSVEKDQPHQAMPPLQMIRAFQAAGRMGSMRKAADDLGVSHSVVSRHVKNLEFWMAVKLVVSSPRGLRLTREGEIFHAAISTAFELIAATTAELRPPSHRRTLRLWCMPGLATRWLGPRLPEMQHLLGDTELVFRAIDRLPDFSVGEADVMVGFGDPDDLPVGATLLVHPRMFPVASRQWLDAAGPLESIAALVRAPLIHEENCQQWADWFRKAGVAHDALQGPRLWDASLGFEAALAGQGVALATRLTTGDEMTRGRLVELFDTDIRLGAYYFIAAPARRKDRAIRKLHDWLAGELMRSEAAAASSSDRSAATGAVGPTL
jgi:LysR family glycine cleavage system transcriptional activator